MRHSGTVQQATSPRRTARARPQRRRHLRPRKSRRQRVTRAVRSRPWTYASSGCPRCSPSSAASSAGKPQRFARSILKRKRGSESGQTTLRACWGAVITRAIASRSGRRRSSRMYSAAPPCRPPSAHKSSSLLMHGFLDVYKCKLWPLAPNSCWAVCWACRSLAQHHNFFAWQRCARPIRHRI